MWVYFWALYCLPLIYLSILLPITHCLDYCSFRVSRSGVVSVLQPNSSLSILCWLFWHNIIKCIFYISENISILLYTVDNFFHVISRSCSQQNSLAVQWLRLHLPMIQPLVGELRSHKP